MPRTTSEVGVSGRLFPRSGVGIPYTTDTLRRPKGLLRPLLSFSSRARIPLLGCEIQNWLDSFPCEN
ncbi:hypothetical protein CEXT_566021 [Caerostris extrusa]|uniref:Uncharacterized protein n=1 Tax=Caerostris extrusa TaxID=172846 RepID=A0AAV4YEF0_CAEEX|nr:hypothetical protein CEXT_566021 [Caerostris extrusa]